MIQVLIKKIMEECRLKQKDLADVLEVPLQRVKRLSGGDAKNLTREEGERLIRKLNVRAEWLATGSGPMFRPDSEQELQRRLDAVADATQRAALKGLTQDEQARVQSLLLGLELKKADLVRDALDHLGPKERRLVGWYRAADEKGKKAIEATAKALSNENKTGG